VCARNRAAVAVLSWKKWLTLALFADFGRVMVVEIPWARGDAGFSAEQQRDRQIIAENLAITEMRRLSGAGFGHGRSSAAFVVKAFEARQSSVRPVSSVPVEGRGIM
jgi:hypothetical protein